MLECGPRVVPVDPRRLPHLLEECVRWPIPGSPWSLQGHSRAGERTGFWIPELRLFFDMGLPSKRHPAAILATHSHSDHSIAVPELAMGSGGRSSLSDRPCIYVPAPMDGPLRHLCRASESLNMCLSPAMEREVINTHPVVHGDCLDSVVPDVRVRVVDCSHSVPCVGYVLSSCSQRLLPEYAGLPGKALGALRRAGTALTELVEVPRFAFLGDTTVDVFSSPSGPQILASPVVMVECTLLGLHPEDCSNAQARGHVAWPDLRPIVAANPAVLFVLIHFSQRYSDEDVVAALRADMALLPNLAVFLDAGVYRGRDTVEALPVPLAHVAAADDSVLPTAADGDTAPCTTEACVAGAGTGPGDGGAP